MEKANRKQVPLKAFEFSYQVFKLLQDFIVVQMLSVILNELPEEWTRADLQEELSGISGGAVSTSLRNLHKYQVLHRFNIGKHIYYRLNYGKYEQYCAAAARTLSPVAN